MTKIRVDFKKEIDFSHDIIIESGIIEKISSHLRDNPVADKYVIITDYNVKSLYAEKIFRSLEDEGIEAHIIDFPPGEESKNWKNAGEIIRKIARKRFERRNSAIINIGGGVTLDIGGFVALTYMGGIPYIQVPTTPTAQYDACMGGKTGVDIPEGKNIPRPQISMPKRIYIDPLIIKDVPDKEFRAGLSEAVKHGIVKDEAYFGYIEKNIRVINQKDTSALKKVILGSVKIKSNIVRIDPWEENLRYILNYGHTFGHDLETLTHYSKYNHGEAVSIGMVFEGTLAARKGLWKEKDLERQNNLLKEIGLPINIPYFNPEKLIKQMYYDKKVENGKLMFVLPERIGKMKAVNGRYKIPVSKQELKDLINEIYKK